MNTQGEGEGEGAARPTSASSTASFQSTPSVPVSPSTPEHSRGSRHDHDFSSTTTIHPLRSVLGSDAITETTTETESVRPPSPKKEACTSERPIQLDSEPNSTSGTTSPRQLQNRPFKVRDWIFEILNCIVSLASLVVIVAVLRTYDGRELPSLPLHITLNTFLAFFTTLTKATFMSAIIESISQWKWNWFTAERFLSDFELYDEATRGNLGSFRLLWRLRWRHIACLGPLISIAGVITSPLTQQMIQYPQMLTSVNGTATVGIIRNYAMGSEVQHFTEDTAAALDVGITSQVPLQPLEPECSTADCLFPRINTLGICSMVVNVTSLLEVSWLRNATPEDWTITYPETVPPFYNGTAMNVTLSEYCYVTAPNNYWMTVCSIPSNESLGSSHYPDIRDSTFYVLPVMYTDFDSAKDIANNSFAHVRPQALEMIFYACVQTYDLSVHNSAANYSLVTTSVDLNRQMTNGSAVYVCDENTVQNTIYHCRNLNGNDGVVENGYVVFNDPAAENTSTATPQDLDDHYYIDRAALVEFGSAVNAQVQAMFATDEYNVSILATQATFHLMDALYNGTTPTHGAWDAATQMKNIQTFAQNIATSLSNNMRSPINPQAAGRIHNVTGRNMEKETFVSIRWAWLALLATQLALSIVYLAITMVMTYRLQVQVLKSAALPVMVALDAKSRAVVGGVAEMKGTEQGAKRRKARLRDSGLILEGLDRDGETPGTTHE